jgi:signal transduction histidine kinase
VPAFALFSVTAVGATGALLLWRAWQASIVGIAHRQGLLVRGRAELLAEELSRLRAEIGRLSQLAELDLADGNLEPEKRVLKIARKDTVLFSITVVVLDSKGLVVWSEPQGGDPLTEPPGRILQAAREHNEAVLLWRPGRLLLAAPIAGQGAMVGVLAHGRHEIFGETLRRTMGHSGGLALYSRKAGPRVSETVVTMLGPAERVMELPRQPGVKVEQASTGHDRQTWLTDRDSRRWLMTEHPVSGTELWLRQVQAVDELDDELAGPYERLITILAASLILAVLGGMVLAAAIARLEKTRAELESARELAAMGKTAVAIAHEVKNSLNGLSVAVDLLASGKATQAAVTTVHGQAREEVERLRSIADDLTLFAGRPRLQLAEAELCDLARRTVLSLGTRAADHGVDLNLDLDGAGVLPVRADVHKLLAALINVARNGIEAMDDTPAPRELTLRALRHGQTAVLEIADRGPGIDPGVRHQLFEPFVTTKRTGIGLGLSIAHRVIEAHGGLLEAEDRQGGGSTFRVVLPLAA